LPRHFRSVTILAPRISQYILTSYCASNGSPPCRNMPSSNWHSPSWRNTNSDTWWQQEDEDRLRGSYDGSRGDEWLGDPDELYHYYKDHGGSSRGSSRGGDGDQRRASRWASDRWTASTAGSSTDYTRTVERPYVSETPKGNGKGKKGKPNCGDHRPGIGQELMFKSWRHAFYDDFPGAQVQGVEVPSVAVKVIDVRTETISDHQYVAVLVDVGHGQTYWTICSKDGTPWMNVIGDIQPIFTYT
jgi:hypothetical protein